MYSLRHYARRWNRLSEIPVALRLLKSPAPVILEYLDLRRLAYPAEVELSNGKSLVLQENEETKILWNIFIRRCYSVRGDEKTIVDAGGNIGIFALYAAAHAPGARIFSLEPVPETYQRLVENLRRNGLDSRVIAENRGLAVTAGAREIVNAGVPSGQVRLRAAGEQPSSTGALLASCCTLESFLNDHGLDEVDLLKMDIEGSEFEVLLSTPPEVLNRFARLHIEVHHNRNSLGYDRAQLIDYLGKSGHVVTRLETDELDFAQLELVRRTRVR